MLLSPTVDSLDYQSLVNTEEGLTQGLVYWQLGLPGRHGGTRIYDLTQGLVSTRTGMAAPPTSTSGPGLTTRLGGWREERFAGAFSGSNDAIVLPALNLGTVHTIAYWVKHLAFNGIVVAGASGYFIGYVDGSGNTYYSSAAQNVSWTSGLVLGAWSHVAFVRNGTSVTYYRNGRAVGSVLTLANNNAFTVAQLGDYAAPAFPLNGALDDVQFYLNTRLSATQIAQIYLDGRTFHTRMLRRVGMPQSVPTAVTDAHLTLALTSADVTTALEAHVEAHLALELIAADATMAMQIAGSRHLTLALVAANATMAMDAHIETHVTLALVAADATTAIEIHAVTPEAHITLTLIAADAISAIAIHQPALAAPVTWLEAAAQSATVAEETGAYGPVILVDFPTFTRTFSTHPPLFGAEESRLARLAEGGVGAISRDLDEVDGGARLGGSSIALVSDAGFIETFANGPLLNTPAHIRLGFEGLTEAQFLRIWTGVLDRYQFTHQRLEFALIDSGVKDSINLDVPIGADLFPNAPSESRGLNIPIFIGVHTHAPVIQISGVEATGAVSFAMDADSQSILLLEDVNSFPSTGTVTVGTENVNYLLREQVNIGGITYIELSVLTRTAPVTHAIGAVVTLADIFPSYITGFGVDAVNAVRVNNVALDVADVSVSAMMITGHPVPIVQLFITPGVDDIVTVDVNASSPLLAYSAPPPDDPDATELVVNGGFETGSVAGWTEGGSGPAAIVRSATGMTGSYVLELRGTPVGASKTLYQDITTIIGERYSWRVRYYNVSLDAYWGVDLGYVHGKAQGVLSIGPIATPSAALYPLIGMDRWIASTGSFIATATTTRLTLSSSNNLDNSLISTLFDEATIKEAPLPAMGSQLVNGGFETEDLTGWTQSGTVESALVSVGNGHAFEGDYFATLQGGDRAWGSLSQEITTIIGQRYDYSARVFTLFELRTDGPTNYYNQSCALFEIGTPTDTGLYAKIGFVSAGLPAYNDASTTALAMLYGNRLDVSGVWNSVQGTFIATATTTRLTLSSQYRTTHPTLAAEPRASFFDAVSLATLAETPPSTGTPSLYHNDGENPVDVLLYLLALFYPSSTYNVQAFSAARAQLDTMRFRGLLTNPGDSGTLLQRAGGQCKSLVQKNPMGEYTITVLDDTRPTAMAFTPANIVIESFERASVPVDSVFTSFYVYFDTNVGGSTSPGDYAGVVYCTPTGTTAPDSAALIALCLEARTFYGRDHRNDYYADFVKDIDTAHQLLAWRVSRYAIRQDSLTWRAWLDAVPLQLGQVVSVVHPVLANSEATQLAELTNWYYQASDHHVTLTARTLGETLDAGLTQPGAPVAYPDVGTTEPNTPVVLEILANDLPGLGGVLNPFSIDLDPSTGGRQTTYTDTGKGVFTVDTYGYVTVTPVTDYSGTIVASYTVADQFGSVSNSTTITITMAGHLTLALIAQDATTAIEMHVDGGEEELAQACNFVFGNDIDDQSVDGGNDTGIHIINAFCYFPEADTAMACSGDPSMVGGTGAVSGPGFNDVYTSSRLGNAVMNPYTSFLGTIDVTANGHGVTAMVAMAAYDGLLYVAMNTSLDSDQAVNGPPVIFTVDNITSLDDDSYYDTWVEAQEFATTFSRVGTMAQHNGNLYVALEPKTAGVNALAIWQFDGATWSLQHSFGTSFSRLRAFFGVGAMLYAGVDGQLWYATAGTWAHAQTFAGAVDSLSFKDGLIYVNVRNGSNREIWRGSSDDNIFTLFHTFSGETGTLVGPMGTGMPHPDAVEGYLYVPVHEADGTKVYRWDGVTWTMDHDYGTDFLGVSAMQLMGQVLFLALPRRLHTSDPAGGNVPGCEIWGVNCYYPPVWDLFYDVAIVDFTSLMTDEVIPAPPDATWDVTTLTLDELVFPDLDLTLSVGIDGVITGERTDTSYGGPYTTTYRCDDSLGRHWAGTFSITFTAG